MRICRVLLFFLPSLLTSYATIAPIALGSDTPASDSGSDEEETDDSSDDTSSSSSSGSSSTDENADAADAEETVDTEQDVESPAAPKSKSKAKKPKKSSRDNRRESNPSLFYLPVSVGWILPTKSGFAGTWVASETLSFEIEYLSGSYGLGFLNADLVSLSERLTTIRARYYFGNSFNLFAGAGQRSYSFNLGNDYLAKITDYNASALPSLEAENQTLSFGIGNRWQFDNGITLGFDWFEWIAPVGEGSIDDKVTSHIKDEKYRERARKVLSYMRFGSTFNSMKLALGYTF